MIIRCPIRFQTLAVTLAGVVVFGALFAAGAAPNNSSARAVPTSATTRTPYPTSKPTGGPVATSTPRPTATPYITYTPEPLPDVTNTPGPRPTLTPIPKPTNTPLPKPTVEPRPAAGSLAFTEPTFSVKEESAFATIYVQRTVINGLGDSGAVTVKYETTTGGSATAGADYTTASGVLSWKSGESTTKSFRVYIKEDTLREQTETVSLRLYDVVGKGTIARSRETAKLSILDNEIGVIDTKRPSETITNPGANARISNLNTISGTAKDEGGSELASVGLIIERLSDGTFWDGTTWGTSEVTLSTTLSGNSWSRSKGNPRPSVLRNDTYQLTAIALDGAGNSGRFTERVRIDSIPPTLSLFAPAKGATLRSLQRASGTVSDGIGKATVVLFLRRLSDGKYSNGLEWLDTPKALSVQQNANGEWTRLGWPTLVTGDYTLTATATSSSTGLRTSITNNFSIFAPNTSAGNS